MADKEEERSAGMEALMLLGALGVLIALWYFAGGPGKADLRGLFLSPPQPLGTGEAYGPQFGTSTTHTEAPAQDSSYTPPQY